ncbi:hypothetical protein T12_2831 [Trichinella patagoniensis]|uniref:Uncharacterized protein n=1 Tax=Trichinella patagoniensis TaxID=990121 RepID=A0A0V0Z974_9BILA|nr:hypothetical protein T12_2831 [Trichinella patagoniensis]
MRTIGDGHGLLHGSTTSHAVRTPKASNKADFWPSKLAMSWTCISCLSGNALGLLTAQVQYVQF